MDLPALRSCHAGVLSLVLLITCSGRGGGAEQPPGKEPPPPASQSGTTASQPSPQRASADDVRVLDPYIGRFRSKTFRDQESGKTLHYVVEYEWFDANRSIAKFTVSTVVDGTGKETINGQGFYGYDPFEERLYVFGAFTSGMSGFGSVGELDRRTHRRVTWARSRNPAGVTVYVRDAFEVVDQDTWKDVTSIREGETGEWKVVYTDTFTRIEE